MPDEDKIREIVGDFCHLLSKAEWDDSLKAIIVDEIRRAEESPSDCGSVVSLRWLVEGEDD